MRWLRTLSIRLTLWNTLVVLLVLLVALFAVREGLRYYLLLETDQFLSDEAHLVLLAIEAMHPDREETLAEIGRIAASHSERGWFVRWLDEEGNLLFSSRNAPNEILTTGTPFGKSATLYVSADVRSVEHVLRKPGLPKYRARVGAPMAFVNTDVGRLTRVLFPVGLVLFLLAPLGGAILARAATAPLRDIIETTQRLRPSHLDERLKIRGTDDELDQLAIQINNFLDQIALHLAKHRDYLADAAHELRSPLAAIQSNLDVVLERPRSTEEYREVLSLVENECQHLISLVSQLLSLAEADTGVSTTPCVPVELAIVLQNCCDLFEPVAEEKSIALTLSSGPEAIVRGCPQQLRQLFTNLIDNAIKFTPPGGRVNVALSTDERSDGKFTRVTVDDSGPGIPEDLRQRVFDRFYQVDPARQRNVIRGNGLGLPICQSITENLGGSIDVTTSPEGGARFQVLLPAHQDQPDR